MGLQVTEAKGRALGNFTEMRDQLTKAMRRSREMPSSRFLPEKILFLWGGREVK